MKNFDSRASPSVSRAADGRPGPPAPRFHPLALVAAYLVAFVLLQSLLALPVVVIWALAAEEAASDLLQAQMPGELVLLTYALLAPALVPVTLAFLRHLNRRHLAYLGVRLPAGGWPAARRQAALAATGGLILIFLWLGIAAALSDVHYDGMRQTFRHGPGWWPSPSAGPTLLALVLLGFLIQAATEEWVFRGYVYRTLKERWSWPTAAGLSSVLFAFLHTANPFVRPVGLMNTFLLALLLACLVAATDSLWTATLFHGAWNFALASLLSLPVSGVEIFCLFELSLDGDDLVTGGDYGPEGSVLLTGILLPAVVLAARWADKKQGINNA